MSADNDSVSFFSKSAESDNLAAPEPSKRTSTRGTKSKPEESPKPQDDAGNPALQMAAQLFDFHFHPVVIFGNSASGKTSLVLSLLASLKLEADWEIHATLNDPVVSLDTDYGRNQKEESIRLFNQTVQQFIAGQAAPATRATAFFLPLTLRSSNLNQQLNIALMESNGEAYRPNPETSEFFATLKSETEQFIRDYQGGISFIYVLPYTQLNVRSTDQDISVDPARLREAESAVVGVMQSYQKVRADKSKDNHLLLVTKWDAHQGSRKHDEELDIVEVLTETHDDIEQFLGDRYPQAHASYKSLSVEAGQRRITNYCAGLISGRTITPQQRDRDVNSAIRQHQKKVWRWIWKNASGDMGRSADPFPPPKRRKSIFGRIFDMLDKIFN